MYLTLCAIDSDSQRRLSGTVGPDDGDPRVQTNINVDLLEDDLGLFVSERDVGQLKQWWGDFFCLWEAMRSSGVLVAWCAWQILEHVCITGISQSLPLLEASIRAAGTKFCSQYMHVKIGAYFTFSRILIFDCACAAARTSMSHETFQMIRAIIPRLALYLHRSMNACRCLRYSICASYSFWRLRSRSDFVE